MRNSEKVFGKKKDSQNRKFMVKSEQKKDYSSLQERWSVLENFETSGEVL